MTLTSYQLLHSLGCRLSGCHLFLDQVFGIISIFFGGYCHMLLIVPLLSIEDNSRLHTLDLGNESIDR